jgi:putative spermidine/putrescine transport system substrate-binding protein
MTLVAFLTTACNLNVNQNDPEIKNWALLTKSAKGSTITIAVNHSNPLVVTWLKKDFSDYLKLNYDMTVKIIDQPLIKTLDELAKDKAAEIELGTYDIILFEKEGFKSAFEKGLLFGPFTEKLLDAKSLLDITSLEYTTHEGIATQNYAIPYGRNQLSFIYNQDVFYETPENFDAFFELIGTYKGQFTYPDPRKSIEGEAFVLSVVGQDIDLEPFSVGNFDKAKFISAIQPGIDKLKAVKANLKDNGTSYPQSTQALDDQFNNGTLIMSMSMAYNYATDKLKEYEYPEGASTFVVTTGTATYTEVAGIAFNSGNKSGAMVALNALVSPDMQASKYDPKVWGSLPVYTEDVTPDAAFDILKKVKLKSTTVNYKVFTASAMPEFSPALRAIVIEQWEKQVLQGN